MVCFSKEELSVTCYLRSSSIWLWCSTHLHWHWVKVGWGKIHSASNSLLPSIELVATGLNIWLSVVSIGIICTFYSSVVSRFSLSQERIRQWFSIGRYESGHLDRCPSSSGDVRWHSVCYYPRFVPYLVRSSGAWRITYIYILRSIRSNRSRWLQECVQHRLAWRTHRTR